MAVQSSLNGRVLHIGKFYPPFRGGMETYLADLIEEQRRQGIYAMGLVHGQPRPEDPSWLHRVPVQAQILFAPLGLGFPFRLRTLIRQFEPDVLHLHMPNNAVFWALLMPMARKIPWVVHWHSDVVRSSIRRLVSIAYDLMYEPFERAVLKQAQRIIVTSPNYLAASKALSPWKSKAEIIPLGLTPQLQHYATMTGGKPDVEDWHPGSLRLLSIGRLTYYKGFETLIEAVSGMDNVQLLIAGGGDMHDELARLVRERTPPGRRPAVRLLGPVSEAHKHRLLASCDIFCLASRERTEAFGLVILEAMQHGKPCIVSDLLGSGLPWIVQQSGSGLLAEVDDPASWHETIRQLQHNPSRRTQLGQAGRRAAAEHFSIEMSAQRLAHLYDGVVPDVFFKMPVRENLSVLVASWGCPPVVLENSVQKLHAMGAGDILVVGHAADRDMLQHVLRGYDVSLITLPVDFGTWNLMQTGIRYALRLRYRSVLILDVGSTPSTHAVQQMLNVSHSPNAPSTDLWIVTHGTLGADSRLATHTSAKRLERVPAALTPPVIQLYQRDAMIVAASRQAVLQEHEYAGLLLLMLIARLRIVYSQDSENDSSPPRSFNRASQLIQLASLRLVSFTHHPARKNRPHCKTQD